VKASGRALGASFAALALAGVSRVAATAAASHPSGLAEAIGREKARVAALAPRLPEEARASISASLSRADEERRSGRLWVALERIRDASREAAVQGSRDAKVGFDAEWTRTSGELRRRDSSRPSWGNAAAAARALGEAAEGTSLPLAEASRAYAGVTNVEAGRYYLADALAASDFGAFCRALPGAPAGPAPPFRSIAPELARLQERVDAAFVPPRSIDRHSEFIRLNAAVKTARELDAGGRYAGARYEYLDALQRLGVLLGGATDAADAVRGKLEAQRSALGSSRRDDSLGTLFLERADSALATGGPGGIAAASAIASSVLPAYEATLGPSSAPPAPDAAVTVTLVRWPYT
jgi:hypothetical protein